MTSSTGRVSLMLLLVALMMAIAAVRVSNASTSAELLQPDLDHPGMCINAEKNIRLRIGESGIVEGECTSVSCHQTEGVELLLSYAGCGLILPAEGCRVVQDVRRPHPDCCPRMVCSD